MNILKTLSFHSATEVPAEFVTQHYTWIIVSLIVAIICTPIAVVGFLKKSELVFALGVWPAIFAAGFALLLAIVGPAASYERKQQAKTVTVNIDNDSMLDCIRSSGEAGSLKLVCNSETVKPATVQIDNGKTVDCAKETTEDGSFTITCDSASSKTED